ncbi:MAG TPA: gentisate 1,2-dioxygenase [Crenalkalicoccus sp.]|nr:gentisate 1,2-dioxygenase [Crenalkalicoccus sp.]
MDGTAAPRANEQQAQLQALYAEMRPMHLFPLWEVLAALVTPTPRAPAVPHGWAYAPARDYLLRAGDLISAEQAERRVLILENPGLPESSAVTPSLYAGLQLILPGEVAPCHRHTQSALRFVLEGEGAYTAVDGERAVMRPFDLVLTPNWQWHDHGNESGRPMIWLDGLDIPTVRLYSASFAERLPAPSQSEATAPGDSLRRYGRNLRPFRGTPADRRPAHQPLFHYPFAEWRESLLALAAAEAPDPWLGHAMEFVNPADGGPVMPTIAAHVRHLPAGFETKPRRSTDGTVFVVVEGEGVALVEGREFRLGERDLLVVPSWHALTLRAERPMLLFGYSDRAAQEKLGLFREERVGAA